MILESFRAGESCITCSISRWIGNTGMHFLPYSDYLAIDSVWVYDAYKCVGNHNDYRKHPTIDKFYLYKFYN